MRFSHPAAFWVQKIMTTGHHRSGFRRTRVSVSEAPWRFWGFCLLLFLASGASADLDPYTGPPGRLLQVGDSRLHLYCTGSGVPTVLFEAGLGGFSLEWWRVQHALAGSVRACVYDRAGYGWSDQRPRPRTSSRLAGELGELLKKATLEPPYVLVGHSFGGYVVRCFAGRYPQRVAGLVLVESSHPQQAARIPEVRVRQQVPLSRRRSWVVGFFQDRGTLRKYPREVRYAAEVILRSQITARAQSRELLDIRTSAAESGWARLPHVPLLVVTRGRRSWPDTPLGRAQEQSWLEMQRELVELVPGGEQRIAAHSGHQVHLDQPEVVVEAVRRVIERYHREPAPPSGRRAVGPQATGDGRSGCGVSLARS